MNTAITPISINNKFINNYLDKYHEDWKNENYGELFLKGLRHRAGSWITNNIILSLTEKELWSKYEKYLLILDYFLNNDMLCKDIIGLIFSNIYTIEIMTCKQCHIMSDSILNLKPCFECFLMLNESSSESSSDDCYHPMCIRKYYGNCCYTSDSDDSF